MATYYFRNAGLNWGDATNWSLTSGGGADGAVPTSTDDAVFDANSGNCTVNGNRVCLTLDFTNYTNTITMTNQISVSGNVTLGTNMIFAGSGTLEIMTTSTLTSNGTTFPNTLMLRGGTHTLADNWTVNTLAFFFNNTITLNNNIIFVTNVNLSFGIAGNDGTTLVYFNGWAGDGVLTSSSGGSLRLSVTIDTPNLLTVGTIRLQRVVAGLHNLIITEQSKVIFLGILIFNGGFTITTPVNFNFGNIELERTADLTLNNPIQCQNCIQSNPAINNWFAVVDGNSLTVLGSFIHYASFGSGLTTSGTGKLIMGGTGILQAGTNMTLGGNVIEFEINTNGVITITPNNTQRYSGIFRHVKGTVIANKSTLVFNSGATVLGASRMNLDNVQIAGTITMDEFFSGIPQIPTKVISTTTSNYTINFTDGFEKLAKNVKVERCTISKGGQLLLLSKGGLGINNQGIRYYNQLPNGVGSNNTFIDNNLAGMQSLRKVNMLVGDPVFT